MKKRAIAVGKADSPGVRQAPMSFPDLRGFRRRVRIRSLESHFHPERPWELMPSYAHVYVHGKAMEVKSR